MFRRAFSEATVRNKKTTKFKVKISNSLTITMTEAEKNVCIKDAN